MKKPEFQHVTIYETQRPGRSTQWTLSWTPKPGNRQRFTTSDEQEACAEAARIEGLITQGFMAVASIPRHQLAAINYFLEQLPDDGGESLHKIFQGHRETKSFHSATVEEVGELFKTSRTNREIFSACQTKDVRQHTNRLIAALGAKPFKSITSADLEQYLKEHVGGSARTRHNHLATMRCMWNESRFPGFNGKTFLPYGVPTAAEGVKDPGKGDPITHVYTPEQFTRLLAFTPKGLLTWMVLGQFAGIRASERLRLNWDTWQTDEDMSYLILNRAHTKTKLCRSVEVMPNLAEWLMLMRGNPDEPMCPIKNVYDHTGKISKAAGVKFLPNAFRHGYASCHMAKFRNPIKTAENDGHSIRTMRSEYLVIVKKSGAEQMFSITPQTVVDYAAANSLPTPDWAPQGAIQQVA